jgi:hypothetical protein
MRPLLVTAAIGLSLIATGLAAATLPKPSAFPDPPIRFAVTPFQAGTVCAQAASLTARTDLPGAEVGGELFLQITNAGIVLDKPRPAPIHRLGNGNLVYTENANNERQLLTDEGPVTSVDHDRRGMALILTPERSNSLGWSCGPG